MLPRGVVGAPSWEVFKARLDVDLSSLVWGEMSLLVTGGLEFAWCSSGVPSDSNHSVVLCQNTFILRHCLGELLG